MRREKGFTVIQLLAALIAAGIVTAIATPLFTSHQRSVQFSSAVLNLKSLLQRTRALAAIEATTFRIDLLDSTIAVVSKNSPPPENNYVLTGDTLRLPPRVQFDPSGVGGVFYFYPDGRASFTGDTLKIIMAKNGQNIRIRKLFLLPAIGEVVFK